MEKLYTIRENRTRADCETHHELLIAKFRHKLKKVGETTRPFRYDLNQIPYHYTVEVTNRFKGLDLIECLKNYGQRFVTLYKRPPKREKCKKAKWLSEEALQIAVKRREAKDKGEKEIYTHLNASDQIRSVAQSCPSLCDPTNHSTPGLPVHHQLPEFTQTHVHRVSDAIQPSHPLSSLSLPAPNPSQHQSLFQ